MISRLRYALLLALSLVAIYIGLWPSLLTAGALLGVPLALLALFGIAIPRVIARRRWLHRFAIIGGALVATELLFMLAWLAWTPRRPVLLVLEQPIPSRVRVVYGVADGAPRAWWRWERRFEVPPSGLVYTRYAMDEGWYRPDNPHPMRGRARRRGTAGHRACRLGRRRNDAGGRLWHRVRRIRDWRRRTHAHPSGRRGRSFQGGWIRSLHGAPRATADTSSVQRLKTRTRSAARRPRVTTTRTAA